MRFALVARLDSMQPHPYFFPDYSPARWAYAPPLQLPYSPAHGLLYWPGSSNYMSEPSAPDPPYVPSETHVRKLQQEIQEIFPNLPVAAALAVEMHLSMSVKIEDQETLALRPLDNLFAAAGTGWAPINIAVLQAYLSGQEIPSLYTTYYWTGRAAPQHVSVLNGPLESALQQVAGNPALALPHSGGMAAGLLAQGPRIACPIGQARFVDEEVEQWIEAAGLQKLHSAAYKDFRSLMQDPQGVSIGPDISFGLKQLVTQQSQHSAGSSGSALGMQQNQQHEQPFANLLGANHDARQPVEREQLYSFRQIVIKNNQAENVQLIDVRFSQKLPLWPHTMALIDDAGISTVTNPGAESDMHVTAVMAEPPDHGDKADSSDHHQRRQKKNRNKSKKQQQAPHHDKQTQQQQQDQELSQLQTQLDKVEMYENKQHGGIQGILLRPGEEYAVTVVLNCLDGPHRRLESGVLPQLVLFTFLIKNSVSRPEAHRQASMPTSVSSRSGTPPALASASTSTKPSERVPLSNGTSAEAVVVARQVSVCLVSKSDAADQQTMLNVEAKPFVPEHLKNLFEQPPTIFISCERPLDILFSHRLSDKEAKSQPAYKQDPVSLLPEGGAAVPLAEQTRKWLRLLRLEEAALHQDIKRFDMFNVKLQKVKFEPSNGRSYNLYSMSNECTDKRRYPYRGPNLKALYGRSWQQLIRDDIGKIPFFMLQVPGLVEKRPNLIIGPDVRGPVHVRFTFDRTPFRRMLRALLATSTPKRTMQLLPPQLTSPSSLSGGAEAGPKAVQGSKGGITSVLPSDDLFKSALVAADGAADAAGFKPDQLPSLHKMHRKAGFLDELGAQKLNSQQREAVASVLVGAGGGRHPLTLFGPPGTGKTVTLVECALQVYSSMKGARLLMCAPQNFSADLLFKALSAAGITTDYMIRLNDPRVPPTQVQEDVRPNCFYNEETNYFGLPSPEQLAVYNIVVCTCGAAGMLREGKYAAYYKKACREAEKAKATGLRPLEFTHVMIDEAGQALGPEALIPLTLLAPQDSCAMLCGDPRQLGPVLHSTAAEGHGLKTSLLEAFVQYHATQQQHYADLGLASCLGMLVHNYRSHRRLLELPSRLYYNNQLMASADPKLVTAPIWNELQKPGRNDEGQLHEEEGEQTAGKPQKEADAAFEDTDKQLPVNTLFYGVRGQQMKDGEAPSYYNPVEASTLVKLLQGLLSYKTAGGRGVSVQDIGVIATYRNQVKKLRLLLRARELAAVRVGTVDDFQGQEARIIFISTVLSRPADLPLGGKPPKGSALQPSGGASDPTVGFFRNPNRFNVAITRAQALMVVLGHPLVLMQDPNWSELVKYCAARGAYRGAGSESLGVLVTNQPSEDSYLPDEPLEEDSLEIQQAVSHIAEAALLGVGDANKMFPDTLEELYESYGGEEMEFRVIL
ncbi:TPA: hypothetical protein ACH3X1_010114 [Trebouxia sp. C0004]